MDAIAPTSQKNHFGRSYLGLIALIIALQVDAQAVAPTAVNLPDSIRPIAAAPAAGSPTPSNPFISRPILTASESGASMLFEVALKMHNFAEFQTRISRGERMTPQEVAAKYEPSAADYAKVVAWLKGQGFTIVRQDSRHLAVFARGKVGRVASSLKMNFARVTADGKEYTSATTAPSVPSDIAPILIGINGLQPHLRPHKHLIRQKAHPDASTGSASYFPSQIAAAYGTASLFNSTNLTGAGQTIAIMIDTFPSTSDLLLFWKYCNINQSISNIQFVQYVPGVALSSSSGSDAEEVALDIEWSSAMAPGARIRVYAAPGLDPVNIEMGYEQVLDDVTNHPELAIHQMSMSFGEGESDITTTGGGPDSNTQSSTQDFAELANLGVTLFASSGDGGTTPDDSGGETGPIQVEYPASDPNVVGVGGTTLQLDAANNVTLEKAWNNTTGASGGGYSTLFARPSTQVGPGVSATAKRQVPDVAAAGDPNYGAIVYFNGQADTVGGTSWSSPMWAGFCALINQGRTDAGLKPLGSMPTSGTTETLKSDVYPILASPNYTANFHDITTGSNITSRSGSDYYTKTNYDLVSGLGSPHMQVLAQTLVGSATLAGVEMPFAFESYTPGQTAAFTVAVQGLAAAYRWQREPLGSSTFTNLSDGGAYGGSTTASLTIMNVTPAMSGDRFQCVITLSTNVVVTSTPSALIVESPLVISTLAGSPDTAGLVNGTATGAEFNIPSGVALDTSGNLFIADYNNNAIREVTPAGVVTTPFGSAFGLSTPNGVAADSSNNLYVADTGNNLIRKISGTTVTRIGLGSQFNGPLGVAVDGSGNVYVADTGNDTIRKITSAGVVTTLAGQTGTPGYADGNATTTALFNQPSAVAVDGSGNVYVADFGNFVVRKISGGVVSTIAGQATISGYLDGPASLALFNSPSGITVDAAGNLYVTECLVPVLQTNAAGNDLVRKITPAGVVSTIAGQAGTEGSANGIGPAAQFYSVQALALNRATGTFYFADAYNQTIRQGVVQPVPTLSIAVTQGTANVSGPVAGVATVTRTGGDPAAAVNVNYSITGTAVSGTDFTALTGTVTIPAEYPSATITVNPISDTALAANPTVGLTLNSSPGYTLGSATSVTITIEETSLNRAAGSTFIGANAGNSTLVGPSNTGVGNRALVAETFGGENTALGLAALTSTTTGGFNTASGCAALQLNTTGSSNTANGYGALFGNIAGFANTGVGYYAMAYGASGINNTADGCAALQNLATGSNNTASGYGALFTTSAGANNVANGFDALISSTTGGNDTAMGYSALSSNSTGANDVALGFGSAQNITTGSNDIDLGDSVAGQGADGTAANAGVIRIGTGAQNSTFIAGISGATVTGAGLSVNSSGQVGLLTSSARFKDRIRDMDGDELLSLQPVTYQYKTALDPTAAPQFGLVAEDVAKSAPDLVVRDQNGAPYTVRYQAVNALLLDEFLKDQREVQAQQALLDAQQQKLRHLQAQVRALSPASNR